MTQSVMTTAERCEALKSVGYTDREAAFLTLAGLQSGYFLRRQYAQFVGKTPGGTVAALVEKLFAREHAKTLTYTDQTHIYHLCARPFYELLGQGDNRNRRDHQPLTIKSKLMALDFILAHPQHTYFATEHEKIDYFLHVLKVDPGALPAKRYHGVQGSDVTTRYFVDKFPIYTAPAQEGEGSEVGFCYVDAGATTVSGFETYLDLYRALFAAVGRFRVVYVAARPLMFKAAEHTFFRFLNQSPPQNERGTSVLPPEMLVYFEMRDRYEHGDRASFDRARLIRFRDLRERFSGSDCDALFHRWRDLRAAQQATTSPPKTTTERTIPGAFSVCLLEHNYDLFGTLTAA